MSVSWGEMARSDGEMARHGEERIGGRLAYLATVRKDGSPRVFPVAPFTDGEQLWLFVGAESPKRFDLLNDTRFALHCSVEDNQGGGGEFHVTGIAEHQTDPTSRAAAIAAWTGSDPIEESYLLFGLKVCSAVHTVYDARAPIRRHWVCRGAGHDS